MTRSRPFAQVDVFASGPYTGNPVAVVLDAEGLDDAAMAAFARWTNLSETTFVLPPQDEAADYRLRIFTPGGELPFAGHPTLGSAHAWLEHGGVARTPGRVVQECGVGLVELRVESGALAFAAPERRRTGPLDDALLDRAAGILSVPRADIVDHQWVDNGPGWLAVRLTSAQQVLDVEPDPVALGDLMLGVVGFYPDGSEHLVEVRALCGDIGVIEDPVTGSLNAGLAQWLIGNGAAPPSYTASQGLRVGRRGVVRVSSEGDEIWVGGTTLTCIAGTVTL
ncbi:PhzF family phenazine biosynthesis protein [Nocardioides caldifontis]|uniref:PhzF family phenazine biosynthesis protein n=1 Tax=Nocardioides caldifontis TaxID=2588938 RepID=UPI0011DF9B7D|nr:PhzF family phenazine biosynthesis protein [Nocardioides caldifontis]